ncbi:hypothetical protein MPSEU_000612200 [Mayamaea pseudoterrestris]|nr:hypothetical protein MPSEU_000612200 [Mayamaea pseudoterrestris]
MKTTNHRLSGTKQGIRVNVSSNSKDDTSSNAAANQKRSKQRNGPLQNMLIAVTSASSQETDTLTSSSTTTQHEPHYKDICKLCEFAGAKVTSQVHRKVNCVVATEAATISATQRVRKAWSKGIPVVSVAWARDCISADKLVSMEDFRFHAPVKADIVSGKSDSVEAKLYKALDETVATKEETSARVLDLGCCCACHELGTLGCPWCADCSVNSSAVNT